MANSSRVLVPTPNDPTVRLFERIAALEAKVNSFDATSAISASDATQYTVAPGATVGTTISLGIGNSFAPATDQVFVVVLTGETWTDSGTLGFGYSTQAIATVTGGKMLQGFTTLGMSGGAPANTWNAGSNFSIALGSANTMSFTVAWSLPSGATGNGFGRNAAIRVWDIA